MHQHTEAKNDFP